MIRCLVADWRLTVGDLEFLGFHNDNDTDALRQKRFLVHDAKAYCMVVGGCRVDFYQGWRLCGEILSSDTRHCCTPFFSLGIYP